MPDLYKSSRRRCKSAWSLVRGTSTLLYVRTYIMLRRCSRGTVVRSGADLSQGQCGLPLLGGVLYTPTASKGGVDETAVDGTFGKAV